MHTDQKQDLISRMYGTVNIWN